MNRNLSLLLLIATIVSCGKNGGNSNSLNPNLLADEAAPADGSNIDGLYMAKFETLNSHVNGNVPGSATIHRDKDKMFAYIRLFGGAANAWHQQFITNGRRCPTPGDDLNKDGFIDLVEANKVWGNILIPLDSDLGSQYSGKNIYPLADATGTYFYERVTSFNRLFKDLKSPDKDLKDNVTKLSPDQGLNLEGKVVVVLGVDKTMDANIPLTVESIGKYRAFQTLPVTCGIFHKTTVVPGTPDDGEIPGPVAPVGADPDVPIDDGIVLPPDTVGPPPIDPTLPAPTPVEPEEDDDLIDRIGSWWRDLRGDTPMVFANENNEIVPVE